MKSQGGNSDKCTDSAQINAWSHALIARRLSENLLLLFVRTIFNSFQHLFQIELCSGVFIRSSWECCMWIFFFFFLLLKKNTKTIIPNKANKQQQKIHLQMLRASSAGETLICLVMTSSGARSSNLFVYLFIN